MCIAGSTYVENSERPRSSAEAWLKPAQTMEMIAGLPALAALACPVVSGPSRKSFLTAAIGDRPPDERVWATAAAVTASVLMGAHIVRVHDVKEMVDVVRVADEVAMHEGRRAEDP